MLLNPLRLPLGLNFRLLFYYDVIQQDGIGMLSMIIVNVNAACVCERVSLNFSISQSKHIFSAKINNQTNHFVYLDKKDDIQRSIFLEN